MHLSFPQKHKPYYFPELEFWNFEIFKGSNHVTQGPEVALKAQIRLHFAVLAFRPPLVSYLTWFEPFEILEIQNSSSGK